MKFRSFGYGTDVGIARDRNEDNFCVVPDIGLWAVADGMGGHLGGRTASRIAVEQLAKYAIKGLSLSDSISNIHHKILKTARSEPEHQGMGSTIVAMKTNGLEYEIAWVGDSRAYLWDGNNLKQLTKDHSYVQYLMDEGLITAEQAIEHPARHAITQALGTQDIKEVEVEIISGVLSENEQVLLCSDGLTGEVDDDRIQEILLRASSPQEAVNSLIDEARNNGGSDNITVILVSSPEKSLDQSSDQFGKASYQPPAQVELAADDKLAETKKLFK